MLLGLKGTMGEVELHVMAGRLQAAKRAAAARGELRTPLPVGYVHDEAGEVVIDPDAEVAGRDRLTCSPRFAACGSAYGVVAAFAGRRFPLRAYGGVWAGQLRWGALTHARVLGVLNNPCYAGAYVYGRYTSRRSVEPDGTVHTAVVERPRAEWPVLIHDHHDGYIGWADYLANEAKLAANRTNAGARPPREGIALCQGIIGCGSCGKPMRTNYHTRRSGPPTSAPRRADRLTTPTCRSVAASTRGRRGRRAAAGRAEPRRGRARARRRRRGHRPAPARQPRRRARRRTRPLRGRPGRTRLPRRSNRRTGWSPAPWRPGGRPNSPPSPRPSRPSQAARDTLPPLPEPGRAGDARRRPARGSGTRPPPATRTANGCCAP